MGKSSKDKRDAYYRLAKEQGWRARSAFKLLQLDQEFNLFENVTRVVDLCAAPGSWSQVLSRVLVKGERIGRREWEDRRYRGLMERRGEGGEEPSFGTETLSTDSMAADAPNASTTPGPAPSTATPQPPITPRPPIKIVALDLQPISPLEGITCLKADITHPSTIPLLLRALDPEEQRTPAPKVDLVLSDGAPDVTGLHDLDMYVQSQLVWAALNLALRVLRPGQVGSAGGTFVAKVFRVREVDLLFAQLRVAFDSVVVAKPRSSRASSGEAFVVCRGFRPPEGWSAGLEAPLGLPAEERGAEREGGRGGASCVTTTTTTRRLREDGITELILGTEDEDMGEDGESEPQRQPGNRWIAPFLACGDLSAFDADASHKLPEGHVSLDPIQPPTAPPYRRALEERKKMGGAYGKTKLG